MLRKVFLTVCPSSVLQAVLDWELWPWIARSRLLVMRGEVLAFLYVAMRLRAFTIAPIPPRRSEVVFWTANWRSDDHWG